MQSSSQANSNDPTGDAPCFLVGAERSGTTLLRLMLDHHPRLAWCEEFEYAVDWISPDGRFPDAGRYADWLESDRIFLNSGFRIDRSLDYAALVRSFLEQKRQGDGKPIVGATVHRHFDRLLSVWPDARFVHLLRDGRDVAPSCIGMGWNGNVWTACDRWIEAESLWQSVRRQVGKERTHDVTYEDLIRRPEETLAGICRFLGVDYSPAMLDYSRTTSYHAPDPNHTQQWRKKLSEREVRLIESRIGPMLAERHYPASGFPPLAVPAWQRWGLRMQDRWFRTQFRARRLGLPLLAADFLSRRLGLAGWQKRLRPRINAVQSRYVK